MKFQSPFTLTGPAVFVAAALVLASCGGGPSSTATTPVITMGTMAKGSVIVNGIRFDDSAASIRAGDSMLSPAFLGDGMTVKVRGRINSDRRSGTAELIKVKIEVRGAIEARGADSFSVLGQMIFVDGRTNFVHAAGLSALAIGDRVEVHGLRDAAGNIMATRVELAGPEREDEVRGIVSNKTDTSFMIGGLTILFDASTLVEPAGAAFADGDFVEVHLNGNLAVRIEVERFEDAAFEPEEGEEFEVEGFISGFTDPSGDFLVNGQPVRLAGSVRFRGGDETDLGDNVKVEAEGRLSEGVLLADKIVFKETIRIEANADLDGTANVLGRTVAVSSVTRLHHLDGGLAAIRTGDGLKIRGYLNADGSTITALRVDLLGEPVRGDRTILQGPVSSFDASAGTLMIAGITVDMAGARLDEIEIEERPASFDEFVASLVPGRTIVKARGSFTGGELAADKIEIEME